MLRFADDIALHKRTRGSVEFNGDNFQQLLGVQINSLHFFVIKMHLFQNKMKAQINQSIFHP